jgi:hypothetical protein
MHNHNDDVGSQGNGWQRINGYAGAGKRTEGQRHPFIRFDPLPRHPTIPLWLYLVG